MAQRRQMPVPIKFIAGDALVTVAGWKYLFTPAMLRRKALRAGPIPNTEVKQPSADDTAGAARWDNTLLPELRRQ